MSKSKPLSRAELKRLEQLQKQLELKESKLNAQESKLKKEQKELKSEQSKLATEKKQFSNEKKQLKLDKEHTRSASKSLKSPRMDRPFSAQKSRKLKEDYAALKKKHEHFAKLMRDYKKKADQLDAENKVLRRRVENAQGKKLPTNDKQLRSLMKENRWLKQKLRELMKDLAKQKRWYNKVVKVFKDNNNKWIQKKIEAYKDKEYIIKYVFLDDIKRIVLTRTGHDRNGFKPRIRFKNGRGGSVVVRNVGVDVVDTKVRKRDRVKNRDKKLGKGEKGRNSKDVITKQRPGKDGKNIIKTKYVDKTGTDAITKEKAGKVDKNASNKKGKSDDSDANNKNRKKRGSSKADAATSEFLKSGDAPDNEDGSGSSGGSSGSGSPSGNDEANGNDSNKNEDGDSKNENGDSDEDDVDPSSPDYNAEDWEDVEDKDEKLDDYMIEFLAELGINVSKEELNDFEDKLPGVDDDDDAAEDAKIDKEFEAALKTDKALMFGDNEDGGQSPEMQAQIMYLIGEMDSRNDDLNQLKNIINGVQYIGKGDSGGNEEEVDEKELNTPEEKENAMALVFESMKKRQETFLASLEEVNCDTDALKPINDQWYEQYEALAKIAIAGGGAGGGNGKASKDFEKLRYFVDYFMKELVGRMYDLRCVNAAHYNQDIKAVSSVDGQSKEENELKDENEKEDENEDSDKPVFDVLQNKVDTRHSGIQEVVSQDEVMNNDNSDDKAASEMESVLNDFLSNMDDWKSLIAETRAKHETWIGKRSTLMEALNVRHAEIGELMAKINHVPSYTMNLQKYAKNDDNGNDTDNYGGAMSGSESGGD